MKGTVIEEHLQTDISVRPIAHFLTTFLISKTETPTWNTTCEELNNPWSPGQGATYEVRCTRLFAIGDLLWISAAWLIDFEFYLWHLLLNLTHVGFVNQSAIPCMTIRKITHTTDEYTSKRLYHFPILILAWTPFNVFGTRYSSICMR